MPLIILIIWKLLGYRRKSFDPPMAILVTRSIGNVLITNNKIKGLDD